MKKQLLFFLILTSFAVSAQFNYQKVWSTYFLGDSSFCRDSAIDSEGNIIIVGFFDSVGGGPSPEPISYYNQWATAGAFQTSITNNTATESFITKFNPYGGLVWSTFFGAASSEIIKKVVVDSNNNIYIAGSTDSSTLATTGAFITDISSIDIYSAGFLAKFSSTGTREWCTYLPIDENLTSLNLTIDASNAIYYSCTIKALGIALTTTGSYQENFISYPPPNASTANENGLILKFDALGNRIAGTYCGANAKVLDISSDSEGNIIIVGNQHDGTTAVLSSPESYQPEIAGGVYDGFISKFTPDLATRIWSTYYGSPEADGLIEVETEGTDIYCVGVTSGFIFTGDFATPGSFSEIPSRGCMAKFTGEGARVWGTFLPFAYADTKCKIKNNKLYLTGVTTLATGVATSGAYQENLNNTSVYLKDGFFMQFSLDGARNWGSYFGGERSDAVTSISIKDDSTFYLAGTTSSTTTIATEGSWQPNINSGSWINPPDYGFSNVFLAKFAPVLSTASFTKSNLLIAPNPSNGNFRLSGSINATQDDLSLVIYDNLGRVISSRNVVNSSTIFQQEFDFSGVLSKGIYFAKLLSSKESLQTFKVLVR